MRKSTKVVLGVFVLLIVAAVPLYYLTRPAPLPSNVALQIKDNKNTLSFSLSQIESLPATTIQVTLTSSSRLEDNGVFNYTGVTLHTLLTQAGILNTTSIYIQGSDGYGNSVTNQQAANPTTIIAYQKDSAALTLLKNGGEGPLRLIIGSDHYAQSWVRGVVVVLVG
jgi:DMSO/TMAO reductase YedYZ molybdopterin-dependent catalytic subunit